MSQIEPPALMVAGDNAPNRLPQSLQGMAETATASSLSLEIRPQIGVEAFKRAGFFSAQRPKTVPLFRPDQFSIGCHAPSERAALIPHQNQSGTQTFVSLGRHSTFWRIRVSQIMGREGRLYPCREYAKCAFLVRSSSPLPCWDEQQA